MDKRYQVFVSSTFEDLQEERKEVMQALLELDCIPAGMELFPASNEDQWTLIKRVIDDCDYYVLIIGGRYGSENEKGISYTQMEFEYALSKNKPIISFLHKKPEDIPVKKTDNDPEKKKKLEAFRTLAQKKLIKYWETPAELGGVVSRSMIKLIKEFPTEGWVKAGSAVDENSFKEITRLQKENDALKAKLNAVDTEPPKGSEEFAQGEDVVDISINLNVYDNDYDESYTRRSSLQFQWNTIFSFIAPYIMNEIAESDVKDCINKLVVKHENEFIPKYKFARSEELVDVSIDDESFNLIKIQLRALGLIRLVPCEQAPNVITTYWKLTPYGDYIMTQLLAIKKLS